MIGYNYWEKDLKKLGNFDVIHFFPVLESKIGKQLRGTHLRAKVCESTTPTPSV